jgi:hypothetical protein
MDLQMGPAARRGFCVALALAFFALAAAFFAPLAAVLPLILYLAIAWGIRHR